LQACDDLRELPLGGTAAGTGTNAHSRFGSLVAGRLAELTGIEMHETDNHFAVQSNVDAFVAVSAALRGLAVALMKAGNDMRWLGSGPRAGLGELELPEVQPGSSIMPGKVNPVIVESLLQVCAKVIGNDAGILVAGQASHFELNMMLPLVAHDLLQSLALLAAGCRNFSERCIEGLSATKRGPELVESGLAIATALAPRIGYAAAAKVAHEAARTGETVLEVALRRTGLPKAELRRLLDPNRLTKPGLE
jgi:fumarate hydratase class II